MSDYSPFEYALETIKLAGTKATVDTPPDIWWLPYIVLLALGAGAAIDIFKAIIPDWLIFIGLFTVTAALGFYVDWDYSAEHLRLAVAVGIGLWLINLLWRRQFRRDAFGMGDAKWTMLAVACFGFSPALFAWGAGACLAVLWMGGARLAERKIKHIHFGPFLFIGLLVGIYWMRLR